MVAMAQFAVSAQKDVAFRDKVSKLIQKVSPRDYTSELYAILNWVRLNVRYVRDPVQLERVQTPQVTMQQASGDCDDLACLIAAMATSVGHPSRFAAGAFGNSPHPSHVWDETFDSVTKCWIVLDPVPGKRASEMLGRVTRIIRVPVTAKRM